MRLTTTHSMLLWCPNKRNFGAKKKIKYEENLLKSWIFDELYGLPINLICVCMYCIVIELRPKFLKIKFIFIEMIKKHFTAECCIRCVCMCVCVWLKCAWFDQYINIWSAFHWHITRIDLENIHFDRIENWCRWYQHSECLQIFIYFSVGIYTFIMDLILWINDLMTEKQSKHNWKQTKNKEMKEFRWEDSIRLNVKWAE